MNLNRQSVGVAPGTITMCLGAPDKMLTVRNPWVAGDVALGEMPKARLRWDLIALVGGGSLIVALAAGLIATLFEGAVSPSR